MLKILSCFLIYFSFTDALEAQSFPFRIQGTIPVNQLTSVELSPYRGDAFKLDTTFVIGNTFIISGSLKNPYIFNLVMKTDSLIRLSNFFILEPGEHELKINYNDSVFSIDDISNSILQEKYLNHFLPFFHKEMFYTFPTMEELKSTKRYFEDNIFGIEMGFISKYLQMHSRSFVGFLIFYKKVLFSRSEDNNAHQKTLIFLDPSIRNTVTGRELLKLLKNENLLLAGKVFPRFVLKGLNNKTVTVSYNENYLTLIDYWATWCLPCLREIPTLRELHDKYGEKKFNIISISVDDTKDLPRLKKFVDSLKMNWIHYWDENNETGSKYKIFMFPTYFLLNHKGEIIARSNRLQTMLKTIEKHYE